MTHPDTPAADDELALMETTNYANAYADYRPPAEHATQPDQVDALPGETGLHVPAKPALSTPAPATGEAE